MHKQSESTEQQCGASTGVQKAALKTTESWTVQSTQKYQGWLLTALVGGQGWSAQDGEQGNTQRQTKACFQQLLYSHSTNTGVSVSAQVPPKHSCFYMPAAHTTPPPGTSRVPLVCLAL